jgi:hypothetical protein
LASVLWNLTGSAYNKGMKPTFLALRAIGSEFARRIYTPVLIVWAVGMAILIGLSIWLTTFNGWWWILFGIVAALTLIGGAILAVIWLIIRFVSPVRTREQRKQTKAFVDRLQGLSEIAQTPKVVLLVRVVKDMVFPKDRSYLQELADHTVSLRQEFQDLGRLFK